MKLKFLLLLPMLVLGPSAKHYFVDEALGRVNTGNNCLVLNAPDLAGPLNSLDSLIKSSDIVVVDFWFTGCASCRKAIPELEEIYAEFYKKKVKFYGVTAYDNDEKIKNFKTKVSVRYPLLQISSEVTKKYYISEYPTLMIFSKGKPALTIEGYSILFKSQVKAKLDALVK